MPPTSPEAKALKAAQANRDKALADLQTELYRRRYAALTAPRSKYDATESSARRRPPVMEFQNEDGILPASKRVLAYNLGRDLERNYAPARGIIAQFRQNVVGDEGKIQVNCEGGDAAAAWFNGVWA
jgi:hypothetical protein